MNSECSICFEIVRSTETQKPYATRCGHLFHDNCIHSHLREGYSTCPMCNQPIKASQLIRLYINEPESSVRAKDELIEQLRKQLRELDEKAQLQYNLIVSLNRQVVLEQNLSARGASSLRETTSDTTQRPQHIVAPAKLNIQRKEPARNAKGPVSPWDLGTSSPQGFAFGSNSQTVPQGFAFGSNPQTVPQGFALGSNSQTLRGLNNETTSGSLWRNELETLPKPLPNFGECGKLGAWGFSKKPLTFCGSNPNTTFGNLNQTSLKFQSNDNGSSTQIPDKENAQNTNLFLPITANSTTTKANSPFTFNSVSTNVKRRSSITSSRFFTSQRMADASTSPCSASSSQPKETAESSSLYMWPSLVVRDDNVARAADPAEVMNNVLDVMPEKRDSEDM